jgi:type IV pilus assembly protein PilB
MNQMDRLPLFGEILQEMGLLTADQIGQILDDQAQSGQKFGQIAVRMGWVTSGQVMEAWARQMSYRRRYVDPQDVGIDTAAVERVTIPIARAMKVLPLRLWGDNLVVATAPDARPETVQELAEATGCKIYACMAFPESIQYHLDRLEEVVHMGESASSSMPAFG